MENVRYILADRGGSFTKNMAYATVFLNKDIKDKITGEKIKPIYRNMLFLNENIRDKITDEKIKSIHRNTKDVLKNVEYTIYDRYQ